MKSSSLLLLLLCLPLLTRAQIGNNLRMGVSSSSISSSAFPPLALVPKNQCQLLGRRKYDRNLNTCMKIAKRTQPEAAENQRKNPFAFRNLEMEPFTLQVENQKIQVTPRLIEACIIPFKKQSTSIEGREPSERLRFQDNDLIFDGLLADQVDVQVELEYKLEQKGDKNNKCLTNPLNPKVCKPTLFKVDGFFQAQQVTFKVSKSFKETMKQNNPTGHLDSFFPSLVLSGIDTFQMDFDKMKAYQFNLHGEASVSSQELLKKFQSHGFLQFANAQEINEAASSSSSSSPATNKKKQVQRRKRVDFLRFMNGNGKLLTNVKIKEDNLQNEASCSMQQTISKDAIPPQLAQSILNKQKKQEEPCTECKDGKKACLFVHGLGVQPEQKDIGVLENFPTYWGNIKNEAPCCSTIQFMHMDTVNNNWHDGKLSQQVCDAAIKLSSSQNKMSLQDVALIGHSMGNLIIAAAAMNKQCKIGSTSKWIALQGPMAGSMTATTSVRLCATKGLRHLILERLGVCPPRAGVKSLVYQNSKYSTPELDALYEKAQAVYRELVTSNLCGTFANGMTRDMALDVANVFSHHKTSNNDGVVEFESCRGGLDEKRYQKHWKKGNWYQAAIDHDEGRFAHGDGTNGDDQPIKWFQCQF